MIKIQSYVSVNELEFGASETDARRIFGTPRIRRVRPGDVVELLYDHTMLSFQGGQLCECTIGRDLEVSINGRRLSWTPEYFLSLIESEENPLESAGTVVLLNLGLALSGWEHGAESDRTVTAFRRSVWDPNRDKLKPFEFME